MTDDDPYRLMRFILELRQAGITDARALSALERTPRSHYAPEAMQGLALDDINLPLPHAQAMTRPSVIARVLAALAPRNDEVVLEIGAGSGYQAGALSTLARKVVTVDRWRDLLIDARGRLGRARLLNVFAHVGDGHEGWSDDGPYDRIVLNCAVAEIPPPLFDQLKPGGVIVAPVGAGDEQRLMRIRNDAEEDLGPVRFAPLLRGLGEEPETA